MRDIADLLDDAELAIYIDGNPVVSNSKTEDNELKTKEQAKHKQSRPPFKFHMVGIHIGDTVVFDDLNIPVRVATDDKIEYEGWLTKARAAYAPPECHWPLRRNIGQLLQPHTSRAGILQISV